MFISLNCINNRINNLLICFWYLIAFHLKLRFLNVNAFFELPFVPNSKNALISIHKLLKLEIDMTYYCLLNLALQLERRSQNLKSVFVDDSDERKLIIFNFIKAWLK